MFQINDFYHPNLTQPIKNSIQLEQPIALLTGANMSGKSTVLKALGLCVYLGHLGLPIPAKNGIMPFYDIISIQINHYDDLKNGYSHFLNEIIKVKDVVKNAKQGRRCFAIFDELFKGTNHNDALVISKKTISGLQQFSQCTFFISTHHTELQHQLDETNSCIRPYCMDCSIQDEEPIFTYSLQAGWSTLQIGQILFKKHGLDDLLS